MGGGAVDADAALASFSLDYIGFQPGAGGVGDDQYLLASPQVGFIQQVFVNRDTADVIQVGIGDCRFVDF